MDRRRLDAERKSRKRNYEEYPPVVYLLFCVCVCVLFDAPHCVEMSCKMFEDLFSKRSLVCLPLCLPYTPPPTPCPSLCPSLFLSACASLCLSPPRRESGGFLVRVLPPGDKLLFTCTVILWRKSIVWNVFFIPFTMDFIDEGWTHYDQL